MSENWDKEKTMIAELKTDVKYIREDINIMQKQIRDLQKFSSMGAGGLKALVVIGIVLGVIAKWMGFFD